MGDGILLVDKPAGRTSADVVRAVKRRHRPASIGHLGTLDPMATGVLPLCLGAGTRVAQFIGAQNKAYTGRIRLGQRTDTADATGRVVEEGPIPELAGVDLASVAGGFVGEGSQIPPMYSAIRKGGRRLYELAREGVEVERAPRPIRIDRFGLRPTANPGELEFEVACSKGTYVRVLAEDVAGALGTVGTLAELRRTEFGHFLASECETLDHLVGREPGDLPLLSLREALRGAQEIRVDGPTAFSIAVGRKDAVGRLVPPAPGAVLGAVISPNDRLLAVLSPNGRFWALRRVVQPEAVELYRPETRC
jgi:tRNA pseudouridine55 synthase